MNRSSQSTCRCLALFVTVAAIAGCGRKDAATDAADIALTGGRIYTVDAGRSWAEAVAIRDGRIVFVHPEVNPVKSQLRIWAEIDNASLQLRPGLQGTLTIHPPAH